MAGIAGRRKDVKHVRIVRKQKRMKGRDGRMKPRLEAGLVLL